MIITRFLDAAARGRHIPVAAAEVGCTSVVECHVHEGNAVFTQREDAKGFGVTVEAVSVEEEEEASCAGEDAEEVAFLPLIRVRVFLWHRLRVRPTKQRNCNELIEQAADHECNEQLLMYGIVVNICYVGGANE